MKSNLLICLALLGCLGFPLTGAADDDDARLATQALREGKILPLVEILARIKEITGDSILEVEMEHEDERLVYEVYYLDPNGLRREIYVDAVTGNVLMQKIDDRSDAHSSD